MSEITKIIEIAGRKFTLSTGKLAQQADAAVLAQYGETVVLATVVSSKNPVDLGYFPLTVEYMERLYAGGKIKGSRWVKREGRPSDEEILNARLIDRSIRPLFPKSYKNEVQVVITVLSVDLENDQSIVSALATSAALAISGIPWSGPVGVVKVGYRDGAYFTNPLGSELEFSDLDLVVASTKEAVVMIEAGAKEVSEKDMLAGIEYAQNETKKVIGFIEDFADEVGVKKEPFLVEKKDNELEKKVKDLVEDKIVGLIAKMASSESGWQEQEALKKAVIDAVSENDKLKAGPVFEELFKKTVREMILKGKRPDGRKPTELRKLTADVGILARTHGSAIFSRGQTQVLSVATLGSPSLGQLIESAEGEETKHYIHHYSMPPYSTGETGRVGFPSRREIGHGALAERALIPVIPSEEKFPYTIRVVSEVLSSNGSTSMASVCGSALSLMDAGVPIKSPVSGIAMGLIVESEKEFTVLSDIAGLEDANGDMDFKVAGTNSGITALQLDVKTLSLTPSILEKALEQAKLGREEIMKTVLGAISEPRAKVSTYAPKIKALKIPQEKIGEVIGPGGRTIKKIIAETGAQVEVEDDGTVSISGISDGSVDDAFTRIQAMTKEIQRGEFYDGTVKRIQPFGAFVEILPGKEGLVHVSDMSEEFVDDPNSIVKLGDQVKVRVKEIDDLGRINLSMLLDPKKDKPKSEKRDFGGGHRFERRGPGRSPHFPASRFVRDDKNRFGR